MVTRRLTFASPEWVQRYALWVGPLAAAHGVAIVQHGAALVLDGPRADEVADGVAEAVARMGRLRVGGEE